MVDIMLHYGKVKAIPNNITFVSLIKGKSLSPLWLSYHKYGLGVYPFLLPTFWFREKDPVRATLQRLSSLVNVRG